MVYDEFSSKEHELLTGVVTRIDPRSGSASLRIGSGNEATDAFLAAHPEFRRESFLLPGPAGEVPGGQITLWPQVHGTDGFYICKLRKDGEA